MHALLPRTPLEIGITTTLVAMGVAGVMSIVAVLDADTAPAALATGLGIAALVFLEGGTIACGLACLRRDRATRVALFGVSAASLAINLLVLAIWLEIDSETYGKIAGTAFVWTFFTLIALALRLAVSATQKLARVLYVAAIATIVVAGLLSTWLVVTSGAGTMPPKVGVLGLTPGTGSDDNDLRALGVSLVVVAVLWFAALAADRGERSPLER